MNRKLTMIGLILRSQTKNEKKNKTKREKYFNLQIRLLLILDSILSLLCFNFSVNIFLLRLQQIKLRNLLLSGFSEKTVNADKTYSVLM